MKFVDLYLVQLLEIRCNIYWEHDKTKESQIENEGENYTFREEKFRWVKGHYQSKNLIPTNMHYTCESGGLSWTHRVFNFDTFERKPYFVLQIFWEAFRVLMKASSTLWSI